MTSKGNVGGIITEVHEVKTELKEKEEAEAMAGESVPPLDSGMPPEPLSKRYTRIFLVVCAYWTVSISMVFVNKRLLDTNAPLFVTWFQCVVTVAGCFAVQGLSARFPDYINFPRSEITKEKLLKVLPLSAVFVSMIAFNNLCLQMVGVSFYYVGRSLTTVFNVIFTYLILGVRTSFAAIACCGIIIAGFFTGVDQEGAGGTLSVAGVIFGVLASALVSLNAIFTKKVLPSVDHNVWTLTLYNNVNACILFLPVILLNNEIDTITNTEAVKTAAFWAEMTLAGLFGFSMGYVTGLQIKVTSPLTHNVSGTAKSAAQTVLATQLYNENKSAVWWLSNVMVLGGSMAYARVKQLEMAKK